MPNYKYKAINPEGKVLESNLAAADEKELIRQLQKMDMVPLDINQDVKSAAPVKKYKKRVKTQNVILFTKQLYTLLKAGIPILSCLNAIKEQSPDSNFNQIIEIISAEIERGNKLSDALNQFPKVFPSIYVNSIKVGEVSGTLEETLIYLCRFMQEEERIRKNVKKAFRYPAIVMVGLLAAFVVFVTLVIPSFMTFFESAKLELPLPTKILLAIHHLFQNYGLLLLAGAIALIVGMVMYKKTPSGKFLFDYLSLKLPILGDLLHKIIISRFSKIFYTMIRTGIPVIQIFESMKETLENEVYRREISDVLEKVKKGQGIANSLKQNSLFTPFLVEMVAIGEKAGSLDEMLDNVSEYYDTEVSDKVDNMTSMIEPIVTVVLGGMVLFFALAMFLPMWDLISMVH